MNKQQKIELALNAGVKDKSYSTVRYGWVKSYSGQARVEIEGKKYMAIGHRSTGLPEGPVKGGYIEFQPIAEWEKWNKPTSEDTVTLKRLEEEKSPLRHWVKNWIDNS